jgi:hypothetical protein
METLRRTAILGALPILMSAARGGAALSAIINPALVGAWTPSIAECSRLFERTSRGLSFKQPVDKFAQAVIIRPGEVEGSSSVCRVLKVTRAKDTISAAKNAETLSATCLSTSPSRSNPHVRLSTVQRAARRSTSPI